MIRLPDTSKAITENETERGKKKEKYSVSIELKLNVIGNLMTFDTHTQHICAK